MPRLWLMIAWMSAAAPQNVLRSQQLNAFRPTGATLDKHLRRLIQGFSLGVVLRPGSDLRPLWNRDGCERDRDPSASGCPRRLSWMGIRARYAARRPECHRPLTHIATAKPTQIHCVAAVAEGFAFRKPGDGCRTSGCARRRANYPRSGARSRTTASQRP